MIEPNSSKQTIRSGTELTRRDLIQHVSGGIYGAALTYLLGRDGLNGTKRLRELENRVGPVAMLHPGVGGPALHFNPKQSPALACGD